MNRSHKLKSVVVYNNARILLSRSNGSRILFLINKLDLKFKFLSLSLFAKFAQLLIYKSATVFCFNHLSARCAYINAKGCALTKLTFNFDRSTHSLDNLLAKAQAKACSCWIHLWVLIKFAEIGKEAIQVLCLYSNSRVLDLNTELDEYVSFYFILNNFRFTYSMTNDFHWWRRNFFVLTFLIVRH